MPFRSFSVKTVSFGLGARVLSISMVWALELIALTVLLDTRDLAQGRFLSLLGDWGPDILRAFVTTAAICVAFGYSRLNRLPPLVDTPISWTFLIAHVAAMSAFVCLSYPLFHPSHATPLELNLVAAGWLTRGARGDPALHLRSDTAPNLSGTSTNRRVRLPSGNSNRRGRTLPRTPRAVAVAFIGRPHISRSAGIVGYRSSRRRRRSGQTRDRHEVLPGSNLQRLFRAGRRRIDAGFHRSLDFLLQARVPASPDPRSHSRQHHSDVVPECAAHCRSDHDRQCWRSSGRNGRVSFAGGVDCF